MRKEAEPQLIRFDLFFFSVCAGTAGARSEERRKQRWGWGSEKATALSTCLPGDPRGNLLPGAESCCQELPPALPGLWSRYPEPLGVRSGPAAAGAAPGEGGREPRRGARQPRGLLRVLSRRGCGALVLAEPRSRFLWIAPGVPASSWVSLRSV